MVPVNPCWLYEMIVVAVGSVVGSCAAEPTWAIPSNNPPPTTANHAPPPKTGRTRSVAAACAAKTVDPIAAPFSASSPRPSRAVADTRRVGTAAAEGRRGDTWRCDEEAVKGRAAAWETAAETTVNPTSAA